MEKFNVIEGKSGGKRMVGSFDFAAIKETNPDLTWSLWIKTALLTPNSEGLSTDQEAEELNSFEDSLSAELETVKVQFVGRITFDGNRELYYYIKNPEKVNEILKSFMKKSNARDFEFRVESDPDWSITKSYIKE